LVWLVMSQRRRRSMPRWVSCACCSCPAMS
jgi:hypothetical protein